MMDFHTLSYHYVVWCVLFFKLHNFAQVSGSLQPCSGRMVLNNTYGIISDGPEDYPASAHCEWLIEAGENGNFISLEFTSMATECSYDYLFIYDGNSYDSQLLGTFSGDGFIPDRVLAKSGYMLIYFYSDRNYLLSGFHATYSVTPCAYNCSGHGTCDNTTGTCSCRLGYLGHGCERDMCPGMCGKHGVCKSVEEQCICDEGYAGHDCSYPIGTTEAQSRWYTLAPDDYGFQARTGHAGTFIERLASLYIFGGHSLNTLLDDLIRFSFNKSRWETLPKTSPWPEARHEQVICSYGDNLYMFGGVLLNGSHSNELWFYNTQDNLWTLKALHSAIVPPGVASHTMTLVKDHWLYILGGRTEDHHFLSDIYRIDLTDPAEQFEKVEILGGKEADRRLVGHSTVYHPESKSLLVFGGFLPDYARFPRKTNYLHTFHVEENYWSQLIPKSLDEMPPKDRAFHSATIMGNYMVVYGGNSFIHHNEDICHDNKIYFYHLGCHRWVDHYQMETAFPGDTAPNYNKRGRFSHVGAVAFGNTLLISGGYRGNVLGDLIAYTVPLSIAKAQNDSRFEEDADHCGLYLTYNPCVDDPECSWCQKRPVTPTPGCMHRRRLHECNGDFHKGRCQGICAALPDCGSCMVQGQGAMLNENSLAGLWHNDQCAWCVKESMCQKVDEPVGVCDPSKGTVSGMDGWWGKNSSRLTSLEQCRLQDFPAGVHWIKFRHPADNSHPDEVVIVKETTRNFQFEPLFELENNETGEYTSEFRGFIHPMGAESANGPPLKVYLVSVAAKAWLFLSPDDNPEHAEQVAELNMSQYNNQMAHRKGNDKVFPNEGVGFRYYMRQKAVQPIAGRGVTQVASTMQLEWTGALKNPSRIRQSFTSEFLEPYNSGSCSQYTNCLGCMTDTSCGWCSVTATCLLKSASGQPGGQCVSSGNVHYHLVFVPSDCPVCADHISCEACTENNLCEWLAPEARCLRRGRFNEAIRNITMCPTPCREHTDCSSCLSERNECAWCEQTRSCFPFVGYMMLHAYGGCTHWVDSMGVQQCHNCSAHTTCADCLSHFQCGWCGNVDNPTIGTCLSGDFTGPGIGGDCSTHVAQVNSVLPSEPASWSYGVCPDVEECRLELHDCHENATCINTFESYICSCNRGFMGNGKDTCNRTCYFDCIHGNCSGPPEYVCKCDIGWTGEECNTNCGCHNHSTCVTGLGVCDKCEHWTTGEHCELCKAGAYGNATTEHGCVPCECNGHGDELRGVCNSTTSQCYCKDNTEGDQCQRCMDGYYGDPRNGSKCYLKCEGRTILGNITHGALGSHEGTGVLNRGHAYCLWILTVHSGLTNIQLMDFIPTITFTMETDIETLCGRDYIYVYDGIPSFMTSSSGSNALLLAAYCGLGLQQPLSVEAKSGFLTVYFEGNIEPASTSSVGFNASYHTNSCPSECLGNRECINNACVCRHGFGGINCGLSLCPRNCSKSMGQGYCDETQGRCICQHGYAGNDCATVVAKSMVTMTTLNDPWRHQGIEAFNSSVSRMGHTLVRCEGSGNILYMFGGYSLGRGILNDLWKYNTKTNEWIELMPATTDEPLPRYFHAAVCVPTLHAMYVFGGLIDKAGAVLEMWKYNLDSSRWSKLPIEDPSDNWPIPPLAGHTMTLVDSTRIWIIGGFSSSSYFNERVFEYDASNSKWKELPLSGKQPTGIFGHSAVFHKETDTVYVFGGYEYQTDKTVASSNLYGLDVKEMNWSPLPPEVGNKPMERYFHAAVVTHNYMVVIGGQTTQHDFDDTIMAYRFTCNHWTVLNQKDIGILGDEIMPVIGLAAVATGSTINTEEIHIVGGFNGLTHGTVSKLSVPKDLCTLHTDEQDCLNTLGCAACIDTINNRTYCYSNADPSTYENLNIDSWECKKGPVCDQQRVEERDCDQHKTCIECLAKWPAHRGHIRVCQWCSNCPTGKCIPKSANCERSNYCRRVQRVIDNVKDCVEQMCQASDCDKCWRKKNCIWTRQFKRSSEVGRTLSLIPIYDWNCVVQSLLEAAPYTIQSSPPKPCPMRCMQYTTCTACLKSIGGEGGFQECVWSTHLQKCMPPAYLHLRCMNGECGHILMGHEDQCPQDCSIHQQCSSCLATPWCGWCAQTGLNGMGLCMEGGLTGPKQGVCSGHNISLHNEPLPEKLSKSLPVAWAFGRCPPENECINDHHTCDENENCTDMIVGFRCDCKEGYERDENKKCRPDCKQHCEPHGNCVAPNECKCHFGYVGYNCTTACECNKHSNCESVQQKNVCLDCKNYTQGPHCEECKPLFVGNPVNGGQCTSCTKFCYSHSDLCLSKEDQALINLVPDNDMTNISTRLPRGPKREEETICLNCRDNTTGERCEKCQDGFFRLSSQIMTDGCRPCECHGHSNICDKERGINCDCKNNTKSNRCDSSKLGSNKEECYKLQCSMCMDNFVGTPTNGHQCYRQMNVDRDYCLDPETQMNCNRDYQPLLQGRTVFFAVQPKFLNVDIRIMLDITVGGVNVYFSPLDDMFIVETDPLTGIHMIRRDPKYRYAIHGRQADIPRVTRDVEAAEQHIIGANDTDPLEYQFDEHIAKDFNTFITLTRSDTLLLVRDVRHRLVITLPHKIHNLKVSRFYIVLFGVGGSTHNATAGSLFFRQDQPHIDLFVFFSVFFSCFFLFLAKCVLLWKLKQAFDARRSRHRRRMEMEHMASRPFGKVNIIISDLDAKETVIQTSSLPRKASHQMPKLSSKYSICSDNSMDHLQPDDKYHVRAIALEPTDDGIASVGTFFFQLPGDNMAPVRAILGSTLLQSSRTFSFVHHHQPKGMYVRHRPSSTA